MITIIFIFFFVYARESFIVGETKAYIDKENRIIFISLPEGSDKIQKISFNFLFRNNDVHIKKISYGTTILNAPIEERLVNNTLFNFGEYISHSKLIIGSGDSKIEYDLWLTTGDIPIIALDTEEDIPDEPKVDCRLSIFSTSSTYIKNSIAAEIELIDISESIPRDSYSLNIKEDIITGDVPDVLDLENSKRLKLSASYMDRSFLHEKMSYDIFNIMSVDNTAPDSKYVEVFENNSYKGLYLLSERVDREMFSLSNYKKDSGINSVIYETLNYRADFTKGVEGFSQIEPDMDSDISYFGPLLDLEDFILNAEKDEFLENIEHIVNMDSLIDNHLLFLLTGCTNKLASNNYIYKGNEETDKFSFSPGSLYVSSFGRNNSLVKIDPEVITNGTMIFNRLYEDERYREKLKNRWNTLREEIITEENIYNLIDNNISDLWDAQNRNFSGWPIISDIYRDNYSFDQEIGYIKGFIKGRLEWLDSYINYPPLIKIGDRYVKIDEETRTIFCSLPEGSDTTQRISWYFSPGTEIYLEHLPVSSTPLSKYLLQKSKYNDFNDYEELINKSSSTEDIAIYIDAPSENETVDNNLRIAGWALKEEINQNIGVEHILLFDGSVIGSDTFLGEAALGLPREDVALHFNNPSYRDSGFEINVYTLLLENGIHELYIYAFDKYGNYTLKIINIEINNKEDLISELKNLEKNLEKKLINNKEYNFFEYIFHGNLTITNDGKEKKYNLYVTTSDIPIAIIYTGNEPIPNNEKVSANMQIIDHDSSKNNFIDGIVFDFYGEIGIELRGQTSLDFPKKQYSIEIRDENYEDKNISLLGMPSESDWILGAPYSDKTLMRNVLAFKISNEMGMYAPRTRFVEVFLHMPDENKVEADYRGLYFLAEKIKRDNDRVAVEQMDPAEDTSLSGGYILEISSEDKIEPGDSFIETERGLKLINIYPKGDSITIKQKKWITDYINEFEQALYSDYFNDDEFGYRKYIDIDSFIDYLLINELFKNVEIFSSSTFLYKGRYGKLKAGPVWDFNLSTGNATYRVSSVNQPINWQHLTGNWKKRFFEDEYFVIKYIDRWKQLRKNVFSDENIIKIIESNEELLSEAQIRNFDRWDILGKYVWPNPEPYAKTYEEEIEKLKNWLLARSEWIDSNIDSLQYEMVCSKIAVNDDGCFEFVFSWEYDHNNLVYIYDMEDTEVFSIDMPLGAANFEACLPDGMYTVRTFHDDMETPIQEFIIRKP